MNPLKVVILIYGIVLQIVVTIVAFKFAFAFWATAIMVLYNFLWIPAFALLEHRIDEVDAIRSRTAARLSGRIY